MGHRHDDRTNAPRALAGLLGASVLALASPADAQAPELVTREGFAAVEGTPAISEDGTRLLLSGVSDDTGVQALVLIDMRTGHRLGVVSLHAAEWDDVDARFVRQDDAEGIRAARSWLASTAWRPIAEAGWTHMRTSNRWRRRLASDEEFEALTAVWRSPDGTILAEVWGCACECGSWWILRPPR
ncbi:MAG: hypothetical protein AB7S26_36775 [Sandaracinaceae bacterium]